MIQTRREFISQTMIGTGILLFPMLNACTSPLENDYNRIPLEKPEKWDPIVYNRIRGNAGAIPSTYLSDINGPDGETKHLGKHLPYIAMIDPSLVPAGYIALMWGDPAKGHTRHPNAMADNSNNYQGHWYNWIRIRKAVSRWTETAESAYSNWPVVNPSDRGMYSVYGEGDIMADKGVNTVYLAACPPNVRQGDTLRIWAHCLTHGEYIDFITL